MCSRPPSLSVLPQRAERGVPSARRSRARVSTDPRNCRNTASRNKQVLVDGAWLESGEFISTCHGDDRLGGGNAADAADGDGARFLWLQARPRLSSRRSLGFFLLPARISAPTPRLPSSRATGSARRRTVFCEQLRSLRGRRTMATSCSRTAARRASLTRRGSSGGGVTVVVSVVVSAVQYGDGAHMEVGGGDGYTTSESRCTRVSLQRVCAESVLLLPSRQPLCRARGGDIILIWVDLFDHFSARIASSTLRTRDLMCSARL